MLTWETECWVEALAIERRHGDHAPRVIAERIGALAVAGDRAGVERWMTIATKLDLLKACGSTH